MYTRVMRRARSLRDETIHLHACTLFTEPELLRTVVAAKFDFEDEAWSHVSDNAKDVIRKLVVKVCTRLVSQI
jgi:hypothetical protein